MIMNNKNELTIHQKIINQDYQYSYTDFQQMHKSSPKFYFVELIITFISYVK